MCYKYHHISVSFLAVCNQQQQKQNSFFLDKSIMQQVPEMQYEFSSILQYITALKLLK